MESQGGHLSKPKHYLPPSKAGFSRHCQEAGNSLKSSHLRNHVVWNKEIGFQNTCDLTHTLGHEANNTAVGSSGAMCLKDSETCAKEDSVLPPSSKHSVDS